MTEVVERKSKWGKVGAIFVATLSIGLCVAGIAYLRSDIPEAAAKYQDNLQNAKDAGAVFTRQDALAMRQVPKSENAYFDFQGFMLKIDSLHVDFDRNASTDLDFLEEWKPFEKYLPTILTASTKKYYMVENDLKSPEGAMTLEPLFLTKWIQAICWLADLSAKQSDIETSSDLLKCAARLSIMVDHDPDFQAKRVRSEMTEAIDRELSLLITSHGDEPSWQALIEQVLTILDRPYDLRPCYKYEHWLTLHKVQLELGEIRDPSSANELWGERLIPRYNQAAMSRVHEFFGKMLQQYPTNIHDFSKIADLNDRIFESHDYHAMSLKTFYYSLDSYSTHIWQARFEEAERNAVIQALAIKKGKLDPSKGLPVTGQHGLDYDGKPIRIKKLSNKWIIYSVGRDGIDNGGDESKRFNRDWVVHLTK